MGIFEGLRVVEFASGMAGPLAGMMLADNGAEVIKVEPRGGDSARATAGFQMWNRGKKSVVLDLVDNARDAQRALDLANSADVLIEDYGHALPEGLSFDRLHESNVGLVHCSIRGFSIDSLDRTYASDEGVVAARSGRYLGLDGMSGSDADYAVHRPVFVAPPIGSYSSAMLAVMGISGALMQRESSGVGMAIDTSILDGLGGATMRLPYKREGDKVVPASTERRTSLMWRGILMTFMAAECADGRYILMCARTDKHFRNWMLATGLTAQAADPRYSGAPLNFDCEEDFIELEQSLRRAMKLKTQEEWMRIFTTEYEVGADPVLTSSEFMSHPQMVETGRVVCLDSPEHGEVVQVGPIAQFSETPSVIDTPAPALGEHQALLDEVGSARANQNGNRTDSDVQSSLPFEGITILELATFFATPAAATMLAENGARVIKVEPLEGDQFRRVGLEFAQMVHGKESIAIDLKSSEGRGILEKLIAMSDVVLTNFRRGPASRLGIDYASVKRINPNAVFVYGASFGSVGPDADRPAFHSTPHALSGGAILQAGRGNPPVDDSYGDPCGAMGAMAAIAMGLLARKRQGRAQYVESTMLCSTAYLHSMNLVDYVDRPEKNEVDSQQHGFGPLYRLYSCKTGWIFISALQDEEWTALAKVLRKLEWLESREFASAKSRSENSDRLAEAIGAAMRERTAGEWEKIFIEAGVPAAVADEGYQFEEFLLENGLVEPETHAQFGPYFRTRPRVRFSSAPNHRGPACSLGEQTRAILHEVGYSDLEVENLLESNVVVADDVVPAVGGESTAAADSSSASSDGKGRVS